MPIITISRPFCTRGQQIAEAVASELGYPCISREILIEASDTFNVPEVILAKAIHDGPSIFDRFSHGKEKYIAYIRAALLNHLKQDNIVYHGLAGHFFLQDIAHILKIRTITDFHARLAEEMVRENVPENVARKRLHQEDNEQSRWGQFVFGLDTTDAELYDTVLNLSHLKIPDAVSLICAMAKLPSFEATEESVKKLEDMAMAATVKARIVDLFFNAIVTANGGKIRIHIPGQVSGTSGAKHQIEEIAKAIPGVSDVIVEIEEVISPRSLMYMAR